MTLSKDIIQKRRETAQVIQADIEALIDEVSRDDLPELDSKALGVKNKGTLIGQLKAAQEHMDQYIKMVGK